MRAKLLSHLTAYGFYLGLALLITWPLARVLTTHFAGHPFGDSYEYARHIWWLKYALQNGQPLFSQPLLAYPDGLNGAWLWATWLQSFPAWLLALVLPLPAAFNLVALVRLALNGWAMCFLMHHLLGGRRGPALLAGVVFMLFPAFQGQLAIGHIGLLALWPIPLYVYSLIRLHEAGLSRRRLLMGAVWFALSLTGSPLLLLFITGPVTALFIVMHLTRRDGRGVGQVVLTATTGLALALIFMLPVLLEGVGTLPREGGGVGFSADLLSVVTPSFFHPLFTHLDYSHRVLGANPFERMGYLGIIITGLAGLAAWRKRQVRWWLVLALLAWLLSLGPLLKVMDTVVTINLGDHSSFVTLPWLALQDWPLLNMIRTPARFHFALALALAVMAGYGGAIIWNRVGRARWVITGLLILLIAFEYQSLWPLPTIPATIPEPVRAISERDDVRAVMNMPWSHLLAQKDGMFLQTGHQKPLLAGHVTRRTPVNPAKLTLLQATLDPALLAREQVDVVIWHKLWAQENTDHPRARLGDPFYEDERIAVFDVPAATAAPTFTVLAHDLEAIDKRAESYVFVPRPGWVMLNGGLQTNGRQVELWLDGVYLRDWDGADSIPLPMTEAGYHTVTLALNPPCPEHVASALACRRVTIEHLALTDFTPDNFNQPVQFERGVELAGESLELNGDTLSVYLWWRFEQSRDDNDIRFVHLLDADGKLIAQADDPLIPLVEQVDFDALPDGDYDVYTGWYRLPDVTRLAVLADRPEAGDGWVHLGRMQVGGS